tara:strand:+ start:3340 stop:4125 length:786 start_codon:yes stop_codon:yes gene_type:complete
MDAGVEFTAGSDFDALIQNHELAEKTRRVLVSIESEAPLAGYEDIAEFVILWTAASTEYCALLDAVFASYDRERCLTGRRRLVWTQYDMLVLGVCDFSELTATGACVLQKATRGRGLQWCMKLNRILQARVCTACRTYVHLLRYQGSNETDGPAQVDTGLLRVISRNEVRDVLTQATQLAYDATGGFLIRSLLTESPIRDIIRRNFIQKFTTDKMHWIVCAVEQWPDYLVALCMSQHLRLGASSTIMAFCPDLLSKINTYL